MTSTPLTSTTISIGAKSNVSFFYDEAGALVTNVVGADPSATVPGGLNLVFRNNKLTPGETRVFPVTGPSQAFPDLFPFDDGYQVWGGDCLDADPEGQDPTSGLRYWPLESRGAALLTSPGTTTTTTLTLQSVNLRVTDDNGDPVGAGVPVIAVHAADTGGSGCTSGQTLTLGTTDSSGELALMMPFGTWQFQAGGQTLSFPSTTVKVSPPADHASITGQLP